MTLATCLCKIMLLITLLVFGARFLEQIFTRITLNTKHIPRHNFPNFIPLSKKTRDEFLIGTRTSDTT